MFRLFTTIILLGSYCVPTLLGHAGLHELFGMVHHGSQQHYSFLENLISNPFHHCCSCHDLESENSSEKKKQTPNDHKHSHEENCSLCQHTAESQLKSNTVEVEFSELQFIQSVTIHNRLPRIEYISLHHPRGPPSVL